MGINCTICEILNKYFKYTNKPRKILEDKYDSQFKNYRDIKQEDKQKYVVDKISKLPIHEKLQKLNVDKVLMDFDATS